MSQGTFITLRCVIKNLYRILRLEIIFIQDYEGIASLSSSSRVAIKKPEMEFSDGLVAKDLALSLLWLRFDSWPGKVHMPWACPPTPPQKNKPETILTLDLFTISLFPCFKLLIVICLDVAFSSEFIKLLESVVYQGSQSSLPGLVICLEDTQNLAYSHGRGYDFLQ